MNKRYIYIIIAFILILTLTRCQAIADSLPEGMLSDYVEEPLETVENTEENTLEGPDESKNNEEVTDDSESPEENSESSEPVTESEEPSETEDAKEENTEKEYEGSRVEITKEFEGSGEGASLLPHEKGENEEATQLPYEEGENNNIDLLTGEENTGQEGERFPMEESSKETEPEEIIRLKLDIPEVSGYPELDFGSPYVSENELSDKKEGWYFNRNTEHVPPTAQSNFDIRGFDGYYLGDTGKKVIYLTFDEGYENGYTSQILDILKEKNVTAAFFVTKPYINSSPELVQRTVDEGHFVANHSDTHQSFPDLSDEQIKTELSETAQAFKDLTGLEMPKFFRPPMGEYSARTLNTTMNEGYKTIFWSFAYADWDVDNQPGKAAAYEMVMNDLHNGQITLLHAVSQSNTEALGDIIDSCRENGFEFASLNELP